MLTSLTQKFACNYPIIIRHLFVGVPGDVGGSAAVFGGGAVGDVVAAGQVVFGEGGEVEDVVVGVFGAFLPWRFVARVGDEKMRAGEDEFTWLFGEAGFSKDGVVFLTVGFVPHFR